MFRRISGKPPAQSPAQSRRTANPYTAAVGRYSHLSPHLDWNRELQRWLDARDRGEQGAFGQHLIERADYGCLINQARSAGEKLRSLACNILYPAAGAHWTPLANEPVPYSPEALVKAAMRAMRIPRENVVLTDRDPALDLLRKEHSASIGGHEIHAWLFTNADGRQPLVFLNLASPTMPLGLQTRNQGIEIHDTPVWAVHLALCLFNLYDHYATHVGYAVPGGQPILPPFSEREPNVVPIAHMFVKGLFGLPNDCPNYSPCPCNGVNYQLRRLPQGHREMTGELHGLHGYGQGYGPRPAPHTRPIINSGAQPRYTPTPPASPRHTPTPPAPTAPPAATPPDWLRQLQDADDDEGDV